MTAPWEIKHLNRVFFSEPPTIFIFKQYSVSRHSFCYLAMHVQITTETKIFLDNNGGFSFTPRGQIDVKVRGRGQIDVKVRKKGAR